MQEIPSAWSLVEKRFWRGNTCSRMNAIVRAICCRLEIYNLFAVSAANQQAPQARFRVSGCRAESCPAKTALFTPSLLCGGCCLKPSGHDAFSPGGGLVTNWIYRKRKVVIKWIQLYPTYNHRSGLRIPSPVSSDGQVPRRCATMATVFLLPPPLSESSSQPSRIVALYCNIFQSIPKLQAKR